MSVVVGRGLGALDELNDWRMLANCGMGCSAVDWNLTRHVSLDHTTVRTVGCVIVQL